MVAHRLSTVENFDRIIMFDNGKIVEVGSYNELLKDKNSKFYSLYIREEENE